jgi:hypothetical protein
MAIQAIQTRYAGYRFRSRLEARWAVFLDSLGIKWEYEVEGYSLPSGGYLPDFWLPELIAGSHKPGTWLEIKPDTPIVQDDPRWTELAVGTDRPLLLALGTPSDANANDGAMQIFMADGGWDCYHGFTVCPDRGTIEVQFSSRQDRMHCCPEAPWHAARGTYSSPQLAWAMESARSARFEHGDNPTPRGVDHGKVNLDWTRLFGDTK